MSLFKKNQSVEESQELAGFSPLSSGVYKAIIKQAYLRKIQGKENLNIYMNWKIVVEGQERTFSNIFVGKMVNGEPVYWSEKDGKLSEYSAFGALRRQLDTLLGKGIFDNGVMTEKMLPVYDYQSKAEVPTQVYSIDDLVGVEAAFGIIENHENSYKDPSKVIKVNIIDRVWKLVNDVPFTAEEIRAGVSEPTSCASWSAAWTGKVNDRKLDKSQLAGATSSKGTQSLDIG